jgi:hypothetical protein
LTLNTNPAFACCHVQSGFAAKFARVLFHLAVPFRSIPTVGRRAAYMNGRRKLPLKA